MQVRDWKGDMVEAPSDLETIVESLHEGMIVWSRREDQHHVRYGLQVKGFIGPEADIGAAKEFGLCVRHYAECNGLLD